MNTFFVSVSDSKYNQKAGSPLKKVQLKPLLEACNDMLQDDKQKGKHGQIFPYINNVLGKEYWPEHKIYNDHIAFFDLDWITKECADKIFNSFKEIYQIFPSVLAIQYSASYFIEGPKNGLHIYMHTRELDNNEYYNECRLIYMTLLQTILKVTGYDLSIPQIEDNVIVDTHNMEIYQRINLYWSPFKWNDNSIAFDERAISSSLESLEAKWGCLFEKKAKNIIRYSNTEDYEGYEAKSINEKIKVDRHLVVGKYSGNDLRWRISSIANNLFKENAKEWCDNNFFYEDNRSIWTNVDKGVNHLVLNWLISKGLISNILENVIDPSYKEDGIEVKEWLSEHKQLILDTIEENKVTTIVGTPGIGKTTLVKEIANEMNAIVLTPFNVMRKLYECVGMAIVDKSNRYDYDFENNAAVLVYDQLLKIRQSICGKTIFVDESHILFKDREYRKQLDTVLEILKEHNGKIVIISATPLNETKLLKSNIELKFWKRRPIISLFWRTVNNLNEMKFLSEKIVFQNINDERYTNICLFGNRSPRMIYDNLTVMFGREIHNKVNIFHRDYESNGDIERVTNTEILDKKINLGTSLVYNGLNFKNEGANILVVIEYEEGQSGWWDIIQACTRVRNSKVVIYVIASKIKEDEATLDEKIQDAKMLNMIGVSRSLVSYNNNYIENENVIRELNKFRMNECSIKNGLNVLKNYKWLNVKVLNKTDIKCNTKRNLLRSKIDNIIKKELNNMKLTENDKETIKDGIEYYEATKNEIELTCNNFGINANDIIRLNNSEIIDSNNKNKTVTLMTTIDHIRYNAISSIDEIEYWNALKKQIVKAVDGDIVFKVRMKQIDKVIETWNKWHNKYFSSIELANTNGYGNVSGMINDMIKENIEKNKKKQENRSENGKIGGKNGSPKKKCVVTEKMKESRVDQLSKYGLKIGMEFDSLENLSKYCNVSQSVVSQWVRKGWIAKI